MRSPDYTVSMFRRDVRNGRYTSYGCYPLFFLVSDGEALCFDCAYTERGNIIRAIHGGWADGWRVVACDANWEDPAMYCAHCGERIESAYAEDDVSRYTVIVGNIGTVFTGTEPEAYKVFRGYVEQSESGAGRASGEDVTMCAPDGELINEHIGTGNTDG